MKLTFLVGILMAGIAHANTTILTATGYGYPGAQLAMYYEDAERALVDRAQKYCGSMSNQVEKISNINIQINADFVLKDKATMATSYPQVLFTAVVSCK